MSPSKPTFGHQMRQHFLFDENWVNLNHGAYGTYPKQVADVRSRLLQTIEKAPDQFLRYDRTSLLEESRRRLAECLAVPVEEIVLVQNATLGITTVLRNLQFNDKDVILCFDSIYDAVEMTLLSMQETLPQIQIRKVDYGTNSKHMEYPQEHDGICESFTRAVSRLQEEGLSVRLAVFDTIASIPAVRLPFERLTRICREKKILSLVDGAHGIGQIPLNLSELDADFFISNCHKWLYVPRACAVLHVPRRNQHLIRTAYPTSWEFELKSKVTESTGRFQKQFSEQATADNTPFYCIAAALDFRQEVCMGETAIMEYSKEIAQRGADIVAQKLGTVVLQEPGTNLQNGDAGDTNSKTYTGLRDCSMSNVLLPITFQDSASSASTGIASEKTGQIASWMQRALPADYNTSVTVFPYRGHVWARFCGQIYLQLSDFEWVAGILADLCKRVEAGESFRSR